MKLYIYYARWGKFPWDMGYGHLVELYNIFQFIVAQVNILKKIELEKEKEKKQWDEEYSNLKSKVHK